jgi:hypothetical protein
MLQCFLALSSCCNASLSLVHVAMLAMLVVAHTCSSVWYLQHSDNKRLPRCRQSKALALLMGRYHECSEVHMVRVLAHQSLALHCICLMISLYRQDNDEFCRSVWESKITRRNLTQEWWMDEWEVAKVVFARFGEMRKACVLIYGTNPPPIAFWTAEYFDESLPHVLPPFRRP